MWRYPFIFIAGEANAELQDVSVACILDGVHLRLLASVPARGVIGCLGLPCPGH